MAFFIPKINPEFVRKYPYVFLYIVILAIAGYFISSYVSSNDRRNEDCVEARKVDAIQYQNQIDYLRTKIDKQDSTISGLYQTIAIQNGVIEKIPEKVDSLYKSKRRK